VEIVGKVILKNPYISLVGDNLESCCTELITPDGRIELV
jgi:hypothetical protein